jgi:hypothetical protein
MKYATEMDSVAMIYIAQFIAIGSVIHYFFKIKM